MIEIIKKSNRVKIKRSGRLKVKVVKVVKVKNNLQKKAILVVSFGTSCQANREVTIGAVEEAIKTAYPRYEVRRAFTSQMVINIIEKQEKQKIDNVIQALERLVRDGVRTVVVQPTLVMNGFEYDEMVQKISLYKNKFEHIKLGRPLLSITKDYSEVVSALKNELLNELLLEDIDKDTAVVFLGHGTEHPANATYPALAYHFLQNVSTNILVGTVEGYPDFSVVLQQLKKLEVKKVLLFPLMVVAGEHANQDMAGDKPDSWKIKIIDEGFKVECIQKGLGESKLIQQIYVNHVREAE